MKKILLYVTIALGFAITSCSNLYEELIVKPAEKTALTVTGARITEDGGTYTLTVNTSDNAGASTATSVDGKESAISGTASDNGDGTKTLVYDVSSIITAETLGGSIPVTISAEGFESVTFTADYTPDVKLTLPEDKTVYNSEASSVEEPVVTTNYRDSITVTKTYTASDGTVLSSWEDAKAFMAEPANKGKTVTLSVTAQADKDSSKTATKSVVYTIHADITIVSVKISGSSKVGGSLSANPYYLDEDNGNAETAYTGSDVTYQWYVADDSSGSNEKPISGATSKNFTLPASCGGKFVYVKASQGTVTKESSKSEVKKGTISSASATYSKTEKSGETLSGSITLSQVKDDSGNDITASTSGSLKDTNALTSSGYKDVIVTAEGYENFETKVFVTVQAASPNAENLLSTGVSSIDYGYIAFTSADSSLEYSTDGGSTWHTVGTEPFAKPDSLLVRTKETAGTNDAQGNPVGYIKESAPVTVTIGTENIGTKVTTLQSVTVVGTAKILKTLTATATNTESHDISSDSSVSWQWYASDTESGIYTAIEGATGNTYTLPLSQAGKYIKAKATQVHPANSQTYTAESSPQQVAKGTIDSSSVTLVYTPSTTTTYDVVSTTLSGSVAVKAGTTVKDSEGNTISGAAVSLADTNGLDSSGEKSVTVSATGYEDLTTATVFVTVQAATPTAPALSSDTSNITYGYIKFASASDILEYSTDGGNTWSDIGSGEIEKPASLYVRTKAAGTAGTAGYIAASEKVSVDMTGKVGTKVAAKVVTVTVEQFGDISVSKTESGGTVTLTAASGYTGYQWDVDNGASNAAFSSSGSTMTISTGSLAKGTYRVTVSGTKGGIVYSTGISVVVE